MRIAVRGASASVAAAAAVAVIGAVGAAPASAARCAPPAVSGFDVASLHARGIDCHEAQQVAVHAIRNGAPHGWSCSHRRHGHYVATACHTIGGPRHSVDLTYRPA